MTTNVGRGREQMREVVITIPPDPPANGGKRPSWIEDAARDAIRIQRKLLPTGIAPPSILPTGVRQALEEFRRTQPYPAIPVRSVADVVIPAPTVISEQRSVMRYLYEVSQSYRCGQAEGAAYTITEGGADPEEINLAWAEVLRFMDRDLKVSKVIPVAAIRGINPGEGRHLEEFAPLEPMIRLLVSGTWRKADPEKRARFLRVALLNASRRHYIRQLEDQNRQMHIDHGTGETGYAELGADSVDVPDGVIVDVDLDRALNDVNATPDQRRLVLARFEGVRLAEAPAYLGWSRRRLATVARSLDGDREPGRGLRARLSTGGYGAKRAQWPDQRPSAEGSSVGTK
jgi:hypothetical protein